MCVEVEAVADMMWLETIPSSIRDEAEVERDEFIRESKRARMAR